MKTLLLWLLNRLKERRTYIGLAWLLPVGGVSLRPDLWDQITLAGMALAGLLEVVFKEPRDTTADTDPVDAADRMPDAAVSSKRPAQSEKPGFSDR